MLGTGCRTYRGYPGVRWQRAGSACTHRWTPSSCCHSPELPVLCKASSWGNSKKVPIIISLSAVQGAVRF